MFGLFQGLMPFIGYLVGAQFLTKIEWAIPWVALALLGFVGGKMLIDGIKGEDDVVEKKELVFKVLFVQAIAIFTNRRQRQGANSSPLPRGIQWLHVAKI